MKSPIPVYLGTLLPSRTLGLTIALGASLCCFCSSVYAQKDCSKELSATKSKPVLASASVFSNATNSRGSLRFESSVIVDKALESLLQFENCRDSHCGSLDLLAEFHSIPNSFLSNYSDYSTCQELQVETNSSPLKFPRQYFTSKQKLSEWISSFSQGKGPLGEKLYQQCPGKCSPQFKYFIGRSTKKFHVSTDVVCGHARDKSDNQYRLHYEIKCASEAVKK